MDMGGVDLKLVPVKEGHGEYASFKEDLHQ